MSTTAEQMRAWRGPALLTYGFRPFFLGAGVWAVVAMLLWVPMLSGLVVLPTAFDPVSWHAHEFLFGYLGAVVAGFLLTAVPNWTGRLPIVGWPLGGLFALWVLGRVAVAVLGGDAAAGRRGRPTCCFRSRSRPPIAREIVRGQQLAQPDRPGDAVRPDPRERDLPLGGGAGRVRGPRSRAAPRASRAGIMMVAVIGGRIVPSFTRNWLVKRGSPVLPAPPMQRFDRLALLVLGARAPALGRGARCGGHWRALARRGGACISGGWRAGPGTGPGRSRWCWCCMPATRSCRSARWRSAAAILWPGTVGTAAAQHVWMAGALGLMTLAVMTRATLGHTGQALTAGAGTVAIYLLLVLSVAARVLAGPLPGLAPALHGLSGLAWIAAFGSFSVLYGRHLLRARPER